nr:glycosyltransferase [uncultured Schaedlerella sp.]
MRILWIVNLVMPELADFLKIETSPSGTWLYDVAERLAADKNIQLAIACVNGSLFQKIELNNITYYILPGNGKNMLFYTKKYENMWKRLDKEFQPEIIHIHGTEYSHGLSYIRTFPEKKCVISMQGILNRIKDIDDGGLTFFERIINRTFKENVHFNGMFERHFLYKKNAKYEEEMIQKVRYANCVNFWDQSIVKAMNPNIKVFTLDYNLRKEFYSADKWNLSKMNPYTIFTNPGGSPMKGVHQLFRAIAIVKNIFPQTKLYIPGMGNSEGKLEVTNGYTKYLSKLLNELHLEKHVVFLGRQSGEEMMNQMRSANVVVIPSAIEGTSLILREAMYLGCPCITSFRGGMADYITDKYDGYLYDYQEYPYLAGRIIQIFEDGNKAADISERAIKKSEIAHNPEKNYSEYLRMYQEIYNEG